MSILTPFKWAYNIITFPAYSLDSLLAILPVWILSGLIILGIFLLIAEVLLEKLTQASFICRFGIRLLTIVAIGFCLYLKGRQDMMVKFESKLHTIEVKQQVISSAIKSNYLKQLKLVKSKNAQIIKYIPKNDTTCMLPNSFVKLHNMAVTSSFSDTTYGFDDTPTTFTLSDAERVVIQNYGLYDDVSEQLKALQNWVKEQRKLHE